MECCYVVGFGEVRKKMHEHVFDGENNIDLSQVMKDVYDNFNFIFKATFYQHEIFERQACSQYCSDFHKMRKELGFLITFTRCMLNRCVEEGTGLVINRSLIGILTDIESHFVALLERCSSLLSRGILSRGYYISSSEDREVLSMGSFEHMVSRVSNAYLSTDSFPSSTGFMHRSESMVEFLDQLLENLNQCDLEDNSIKAYVELARECFVGAKILKENMIFLQFVAESAACYSFLKKYGKFSSSEYYLQIKNRMESEMDIAALRLQDSTDNLPPLTDRLLKVYADFVQDILTKLIYDDAAADLMSSLEKNQFEDLHKVNFQFMVCLFLNYPLEELADMRSQFQSLVGDVGSLVLLFFNEKTKATGMTDLGISDLLQQAHLLKYQITDIVLFTDRNKEREMKGSSVELGKICKKMHKHVFDGENIDLRQVLMKDMYENFNLIFKATFSEHEIFERQAFSEYRPDFLPLRKELGFLVTFTRCMLNRCVEEDTTTTNTRVVINRSLVDILRDVESHFMDLLQRCSSLLLSRWGISREDDTDTLRMGRFEHMVSRVSNAYLSVFTTDSLPSSTSFIHSYETKVEFLDQLLDNLNQSHLEDISIKGYVELARECFVGAKISKEKLIFLEFVIENAACYSFLKKYGKFSSSENYLHFKDRVESKMSIAVLKLQDSRANLPPLTDGLLKVYVDFVQEILTKMINNDEAINPMTPLETNQFLPCLFLNYPLEELADMEGNVAAKMSTFDIWRVFHGKDYPLRDRINHICWRINLGKIARNSCQTNQLGYLNNLIDNLRELKDLLFNLKIYETGGFQAIHEDLVLLRSFLHYTVANTSTADDGESKELLTRIQCAASEAEYFINLYVAETIPDCCRLYWFSDFQQQVKLIKSTFSDISEKRSTNEMNNFDIVASSGQPKPLLPTSDVVVGFENETVLILEKPLLPTSDVVVGFENETVLILERLVGDSEKLDVISIIGMAGLGKTTFARRLYEDPSIVGHFELRSWCTVSQEYNPKELLLTILGSITKLTDDAYRRSEGDLSKMLYQQLTGKRYFVVLDDIWGMDAPKYLKRFFPENKNGSRVMLTSRSRLEDYSNPLELRLLTDEESWNLMKQKIYGENEECPHQLRQIGEKIAKKCHGLPLAIVVVAGILSKLEKKHHFWEKVADNLSLYISGDTAQAQLMTVLELSYKMLPDNLKPLFLYLGAFPEDTEIPANKLAWMWIGEGFVQTTDRLTISLEVQAELNLMDLIDRSLVMIAERRSDGRVKSCRVHDMLRDMCLVKAKEANFMRLVSVHAESHNYATYERRLSISLTTGSNLSLRHQRTDFPTCKALSKSSIVPPLSSFLFFTMNRSVSLSVEDIIPIFADFRLLRIVHSEALTVDEKMYVDHIIKLVHLRYISIRVVWNSIPSSISKLWNLETLIIKGLGGQIVVPEEIWELVKLRHLHINYRANFSHALLHGSSSKLENLQTLLTPVVCCGEEKRLIPRVPNLRKFRFISAEAKNPNGKFEYQLPQLESLDQLESLKIICDSRMQCISGHFGLPSSLKKLTLSKFKLKWCEISTFHKLPNLEVLKLREGTFVDALWDMEDVEFSKLKFLKLESLNIKKWIVSPDNFPCLKKLVLQSCKKLEEIPSSVGDFNSLEKIEVLWCSPSVANSAKQIQVDQADTGNELLKVQIIHLIPNPLHGYTS